MDGSSQIQPWTLIYELKCSSLMCAFYLFQRVKNVRQEQSKNHQSCDKTISLWDHSYSVYNFCGISAQGYIYINHFGLKKNLQGWRIKEKQAPKTGKETTPFFRICVSEEHELVMSQFVLFCLWCVEANYSGSAQRAWRVIHSTWKKPAINARNMKIMSAVGKNADSILLPNTPQTDCTWW